jgi:uncharacterized membrane protein YtjA (UPF0391 family)
MVRPFVVAQDTDLLAPFLGFGGVAAAVWPFYNAHEADL